MKSTEVLMRLNELFRDVFDDPQILVSPTTTARDIDGWNSMANIRLMIAVEEEFRIKFDVGEFQEYRNVGELVAGIARRGG